MKLILQPNRIARTTTRDEWKALNRSRRVMEKYLRAHENQIHMTMEKAFDDLMFYGVACIPNYDEIVSPPVTLKP